MMRSTLLFAILLCTSPALAETTPPWAVGVSEQNKQTAQRALDEGNALFLDKKYSEALAKYQAAVAAWDHPAIRFNIVRCLIQLDRQVEAADNLKLALKYGAAPLEDAVYNEALAYEKLLANQIGELSIECKQSGVVLTLDGQPLATCPAREVRRVSPGPHQVLGRKEGFLPRAIEVVVLGGKQQEVKLELDPLAKAARIEHRWPTWVPWVVFGGGAGVVGAGALLRLSAVQQMDSFDRIVAQKCSMIACTDEQLGDDRELRKDAEDRGRVAVGVMITGAAVVATGAVMLYLNRGRTVYPTETITPTVTPTSGGAALSLTGSF